MRSGWVLVAGLAIVSCVLPLSVAAQRRLPSPIMIRIDGYLGPPPSGRHEVADLTLGAARNEVQFQVTDARVITGAMTAQSVFRQVRPYRPNFRLHGSPDLVARVMTAAPAARLRLIGTWRPGSRQLHLSSVEPLPAGDPAPSTPQPTPS